jgi:hypothetical protein
VKPSMVFGNDAVSVPIEISQWCCKTTENSDKPSEATNPQFLGGCQTP